MELKTAKCSNATKNAFFSAKARKIHKKEQ